MRGMLEDSGLSCPTVDVGVAGVCEGSRVTGVGVASGACDDTAGEGTGLLVMLLDVVDSEIVGSGARSPVEEAGGS